MGINSSSEQTRRDISVRSIDGFLRKHREAGEIRNRLDHEGGLVFKDNGATLATTSWVAGWMFRRD